MWGNVASSCTLLLLCLMGMKQRMTQETKIADQMAVRPHYCLTQGTEEESRDRPAWVSIIVFLNWPAVRCPLTPGSCSGPGCRWACCRSCWWSAAASRRGRRGPAAPRWTAAGAPWRWPRVRPSPAGTGRSGPPPCRGGGGRTSLTHYIVVCCCVLFVVMLRNWYILDNLPESVGVRQMEVL